MVVILVAAAGFSRAAPAARAQETFRPGEVVEVVQAAADSTQSYAVYLPSRYDRAKRWPILFLMDPRGRALVPLNLFQEAAEERGYLLMSSYDTMSDGFREPNEVAIQAMVSDALDHLAIDTRRLYMVGFSGTAREAWEFASRIPDNVAGVIGFGAGLPGEWMDRALAVPRGDVAYFGGAGTTDFNYEELRELDAALDDTEIQHRIQFFDGSHEWAPRELCARAIDWMELQAIKADLRLDDAAWVEDLYSALLEEARTLEASGYLYEAAQAFRHLAADFSGLRDVSEPGSRWAALQRLEFVKAAQATLAELAQLRKEFDDELMVIAAELEWQSDLPSVSNARRQLGIDELLATSQSAEDTLRAHGAKRRLENAFVQLSFYTPRNMLQRSLPDRALAALDIADAIKPHNPRVCWFRSRAFAQAERVSDALQEIACLADAGVTETSFLENDPYLEPLRDDARFHELLERMRRGDGAMGEGWRH
jgi:predicted esterase